MKALADAGVAVMAHLGLRPQSVGLLGGYRAQGRTADEARAIVDLAGRMQRAGAAAILLEAVPPEVGEAVVAATDLPVIGCGAGRHCHGHVIVTHDALGLTPQPPALCAEARPTSRRRRWRLLRQYVRLVRDALYPGPEHEYEMDGEQKTSFLRNVPIRGGEKA